MTAFLGLNSSTMADVDTGDVVIVGAPNATPYEAGKPSHSEAAPAAIRSASQKFSNWHDHYDFDAGDELRGVDAPPLRDIGDLTTLPDTPEQNREVIRSAVGTILSTGATPIVLGGDDAVPIPVLQAYEEHGPIWIVQVDAHIDWREERFGERLGWSSTMRRASEMAWVEGIVQIGARGVGSAYPGDVKDAKSWGASIITAREVFRDGLAQAIERVPAGARVVVSLDCDALDPAVMPAVMAQVPGGLTYWHVIDLLDGVAARGRIVGCTVVELAPERDIGTVSALTVVRIISAMVAAIGRPDQR